MDGTRDRPHDEAHARGMRAERIGIRILHVCTTRGAILRDSGDTGGMARAKIIGVAAASVLLLAGCATTTSGGGDGGAEPSPVATANTDGSYSVSTLVPYTVLDDPESGDDPQLCIGAVAESAPPKCSGIVLTGWDWDAVEGDYEEQNDVRWGLFTVEGDYSPDDETLAVTSVDTDATDELPIAPTCEGDDCVQPTDDLKDIASEIMSSEPGVLSSTVDGFGTVNVSVTFDDGSLQNSLDEQYGAGVVEVTSVLVPTDS